MNDIDDFELRRSLRTLRADRPPARDLWPGIQSRIASAAASRCRPRRGRRGAWAGALAAGIVIAFGVLLVPPDRTPSPAGDAIAVAIEPAPAIDAADSLLAAYAQVLAAEQSQGAAWTRQLATPGGPDRLAAAYELDATLFQLAAALRVEPQSQLLRRLMHQTLQQRTALALDALSA